MPSQDESSLIPLHQSRIAGEVIDTVDARGLHVFLEVQTRFNDWITARIKEFGFVENHDYVVFTSRQVKRGRPAVEYHLTLNMAKELSMVERTDQGKKARLYFIECEKRLKEGGELEALSPAKLLLRSVQQLVAHEEEIQQLKAANEVHETRLQELESDHPPAGKLTVHDWLYINQKAWAGKDLRKQLNARCRKLEQPVPYTPKGVLHAWWYYSPRTIEDAWAYVTRQMSFLRDPGVAYQAKQKRKRG